MTVEWIEPYHDGLPGVDHLGLRVAGESAYQRLFDFTTSVSFRPRYYAFLCWALRHAFTDAGGRPGDSEHRLDVRRWRDSLKRRDYAYALASVLASPEAIRIAGSTRVRERVVDTDTLELRDDHLQGLGSFAVYAGPMRALGLLDTSGQIDRPSTLGNVLADAFDRSLRSCGAEDLLLRAGRPGTGSAEARGLKTLGKVCGVASLPEAVSESDEVHLERESIRKAILDWQGFERMPQVRRRMLSVGLVLALYESAEGQEVLLSDFRAWTLLDGLPWQSIIPLELPTGFDEVREYWRVYHAHAYATYALETLLGVAMDRARDLDGFQGRGVRRNLLVEDLLDGLAGSQSALCPKPLKGWWDWPLERLLPHLERYAAAGAEAELHEYVVAGAVWRGYRDMELPGTLHDAALLLLLSTARLSSLLRKKDAWLGDRTPWRRPPGELVRHLQQAAGRGEWTRAYLARVLEELVIQQHLSNALRKLAADPTIDTARLHAEGDRLQLTTSERFDPGTSSPRFENVVAYLKDLGYLTSERQPVLTQDGETLLGQLRKRAGA